MAASSTSAKRSRGSPTGITPVRAKKKRAPQRLEGQHGVRRVLARSYPPTTVPVTVVPGTAWSVRETLALVDFIISQKSVKNDWPKHCYTDFWNRASEYIQDRAESTIVRTGKPSMHHTTAFHLIYHNDA